MYEKFFGFKERPFQLVPNPAYLFLSKSHEEALAHLTYAVSQGDGFVKITGEVGTGKTTLCRVFLENLETDIEAAYIFNPMLDAVQLLKAINDEFGINSDKDNTKDLIDKLNLFLMEKKTQGKQVILLIDEAQNLSQDVLEQLRLLSNLETNTSKLLQIILVGQPELRNLLDSHKLRQLSQRITLSCHILPLDFKETKEYIQHRIRIASQKPGIKFSRSAFRTIYKYSGGIPRLTNIVCDRAILTAYGLNQHKITGSIAKASVRELTSKGDVKKISLYEGKPLILTLFTLCILLVTALFYMQKNLNITGLLKTPLDKSLAGISLDTPVKNHQPDNIKNIKIDKNKPKSEFQKEIPQKTAQIKSQDTVTQISELKIPQEKVTPPKDIQTNLEIISDQNLEEFLKSTDSYYSRNKALICAMNFWSNNAVIRDYLNNIQDTYDFFRLAAKQNSLSLYKTTQGLELIKKLNLPAIIELPLADDISFHYVTIIKIHQDQITISDSQKMISILSNELKSYWPGTAYIPWKNFSGLTGIIPRNASEDSIITLKMLLQDIGFNEIIINPVYDLETQNAVESIQSKHGIQIDGTVGPMTKIILYNEMNSFKIPHILSKISKREARN